jgi:hypothetical protein
MEPRLPSGYYLERDADLLLLRRRPSGELVAAFSARGSRRSRWKGPLGRTSPNSPGPRRMKDPPKTEGAVRGTEGSSVATFLFLGGLAGPDERRRDGRPQIAPLPVGARAGRGEGGAFERARLLGRSQALPSTQSVRARGHTNACALVWPPKPPRPFLFSDKGNISVEPIHPSAWKGRSQKFGFREVLRSRAQTQIRRSAGCVLRNRSGSWHNAHVYGA